MKILWFALVQLMLAILGEQKTKVIQGRAKPDGGKSRHRPPLRHRHHGEIPTQGQVRHSRRRPCPCHHHLLRLDGLRPYRPCLGHRMQLAAPGLVGESPMKSRRDTTSSWVCTTLPVASSCAALAASRTCSSVPSRMMSDKAASTASRTRRARSEPGESATLRSNGAVEAVDGASAC